MAQSKRQARDEFQHELQEDFSVKTMEWINKHRGTMITVFVILIVLVAVVNIYRVSAKEAVERQSLEFIGFMDDYQQALGETDLVARAEQLASARTGFENYSREHTGPLADYAVFMAGNCWYYSGLTAENFQKAAEGFDAYIQRAKNNEDRAIGYYSKGYAYESLGFLPDNSESIVDAMDAYKEAEKLAPGEWIDFESKIARARIMMATEGAEEDAATLIDYVIENRGEVEAPEVLRTGITLKPGEAEIVEQVSSQIKTFGLVATAELLKGRIEAETQ